MNTKLRWFIIVVLFVALIALGFVYVKVKFQEPQIGHGPAQEMTITMPWNGQTVEIPAPVQFPQWGKQTREFRRWAKTKDVRNFTAFDLKGRKYVAHGLGFVKDSQSGKSVPLINAVERISPDGLKDAFTLYEPRGPVEWYIYDEQGNRTMLIMRTSRCLEVVFEGQNGKSFKEWNINKKGQIYWESVRQEDGYWTVTQDLKELKTAEDVPWSDNLREMMEYYPGRDNK